MVMVAARGRHVVRAGRVPGLRRGPTAAKVGRAEKQKRKKLNTSLRIFFFIFSSRLKTPVRGVL